jgi:hypothetical protein
VSRTPPQSREPSDESAISADVENSVKAEIWLLVLGEMTLQIAAIVEDSGHLDNAILPFGISLDIDSACRMRTL